MDNLNKEMSPLEEAFAIAARIIEQGNITMLERIAELEEQVKRLQARVEELEQNFAAVGQVPEFDDEPIDFEMDEEDSEAKEYNADDSDTKDCDVEEYDSAEYIAKESDEDNSDGEEYDSEESVEKEFEEESVGKVDETDMSIPHSMAGLGVMAFASELAEKANESAPGNDVFELMERQEAKIVNEAAKPDWYDWEVDYPADYVDDVYKAISFNDRFEFIKELFNISGDLGEAEYLFKDTLDDINEMENFKQVVAYIRHRFPKWDEQSDEVYRFYMAVRRRFNKQ